METQIAGPVSRASNSIDLNGTSNFYFQCIHYVMLVSYGPGPHSDNDSAGQNGLLPMAFLQTTTGILRNSIPKSTQLLLS